MRMGGRISEFWSRFSDVGLYRSQMKDMPIMGYKRYGKRIKRSNIEYEYELRKWKTS
jgi:hypothetical protein